MGKPADRKSTDDVLRGACMAEALRLSKDTDIEALAEAVEGRDNFLFLICTDHTAHPHRSVVAACILLSRSA